MSDNGVASKLQQIGGAADAASSRMGGLQNRFNGMKRLSVGAFSVATLAAFSQSVIKTGSDFEQLNVSYQTMLGSQEKGLQMMADTKKFAATTPFELPEVAQASKQLLAFGIEQKNVQKDLRAIGDVASGISAPLTDIAYLFGTIKTQGKAMTMDIRQFANRGIPIYDELAKITHKNGMALQKYIEEGKVGFPQIEQAFMNMSGEGGKFFNLMDKQSKTTGGRISNLADKFTYFKDSMFNKFKPAINSGIDGLGKLMDKLMMATEFVMRNADAFKTAAVFIGTYFVAQKAMMFAESVFTIGKAFMAAGKAQEFLTSAMAKNPYGIAALAIAGLIAELTRLKRKYEELEDFANQRNSINESQKVLGIMSGFQKKGYSASVAKDMAIGQEKLRIKNELRKEYESRNIPMEMLKNFLANPMNPVPDETQNEKLLRSKLNALAGMKGSTAFTGLNHKSGESNTSAAKTFDDTSAEISGGGKSITNVTINVNKDGITQTFNLPGGGYRENKNEIQRESLSMWMRILNSGTAAVANR